MTDRTLPEVSLIRADADAAAGSASMDDRVLPSRRHLKQVRLEIEARARAFVDLGDRSDEPISTAIHSWFSGRSLLEIGSLRDVGNAVADLTGTQINKHGLESLISATRLLRRSFNGTQIDSQGCCPAGVLREILHGFLVSFQSTKLPALQRYELAAVVHDALRHQSLSGNVISAADAREAVALVIGTAHKIIHDLFGIKAPSSNTPLINQHALATLRDFVRSHSVTRAALHAGTTAADAATVENTSRALTQTIESAAATFRAHKGVAVPTVGLASASRRSLLGVRLAAVHAFSDAVSAAVKSGEAHELSRVAQVIDLWIGSESGRRFGNDRINQQFLGRSIISAPGATYHSLLREVARGVVNWCLNSDAASDSRLKTMALKTLEHLSAALKAVTIRQMIGTLSVVRFPLFQEIADGSDVRLDSPFPENNVGDAYPVIARNGDDPTMTAAMNRVAEIHDEIRTTASNLAQATTLDVSEENLSSLQRWSESARERFEASVDIDESRNALWTAEHDAADGALIPTDLAHHFEELQTTCIVKAGDAESGVVVPENAQWLHSVIDRHDGFVVSVHDGPIAKVCSSQYMKAFLVATCSQEEPSPLMHKLRAAAADFISNLPRPRNGEPPHVLCELVLCSDDTVSFLKRYGEHALHVLVEQFVFNLASRFPTEERVECLAICRINSVARDAFSKMGWYPTGATYKDENGTEFAIIHHSLFPADYVLGLRDIDHSIRRRGGNPTK